MTFDFWEGDLLESLDVSLWRAADLTHHLTEQGFEWTDKMMSRKIREGVDKVRGETRRHRHEIPEQAKPKRDRKQKEEF